ncbi:MAG: FAD-dependent oxidoreductase [Deltaproteobacteria bacterium]|nr:FAD-dependent oxidoreductase [Deltaproteobacteria bacterium]
MSKPSLFEGPVVVVGGGVTGLVSAHLLAEAGAQVVVIEKFPRVGGLARSYQYDGFVFDCGPHRFHTENPNIKAYLDRVLEGHGVWFPRKSEVYFEGCYYRWPLHPKNLVQLPVPLALKSAVDLAVNGMKTYGQTNFEDYVLRQYGPTLYQNFFKDYSIKFLGIHPRETHPDWAKVGLNRAIIDDKLQMQNLAQLAKSTLLQYNKAEIDFLYPRGGGLQVTWDIVSELIKARGGRIITGTGARLAGGNGRIEAVYAGHERIEPSVVIWTAPITLACDQLGIDAPDLPYLSTLFYNVMVEEAVPREYQWCYYGANDIVFSRVSTPKFFSPDTVPHPGASGLNVEITCREGDERWQHAERLTDWVVDDLIKVGMISSRRKVHDVRIERVAETYPIYHTRYPAELERTRKQLDRYDNLHLAGRTGMFWYNNMDHSMENAMQLTRKLLRDAGRADIDEKMLATGTAG